MSLETLATRSATHNLQAGAYVLDLTVRRGRRATLRLAGTSASLTRTLTITAWRDGVRHGAPVVRAGTVATTAIDDVIEIPDLRPGAWSFHVASSVADTAAVLTASVVAERLATPPTAESALGNPAARFLYGANEGVGLMSDSYGGGIADATGFWQAMFAGGAGDWWRCTGYTHAFAHGHPISSLLTWGGSPAYTSVAPGAAFPGNAGLINRFAAALNVLSFASNVADFTYLPTWNPVLPGLIPHDPGNLLATMPKVGGALGTVELGFILHRTPDSLQAVGYDVINAGGGAGSPSNFDHSLAHVAEFQTAFWQRSTAYGGAGGSGIAPVVISGDETGRRYLMVGASFRSITAQRGIVIASSLVQAGAGIGQFAHSPEGPNPSGVGLFTDAQLDAYFAGHAAGRPLSLIPMHLGTNSGAMPSGDFRRWLRQYILRVLRIAQPYTPNPVGVLLFTPMPFRDNTGADQTGPMATRRDDMFAVARELDLPQQISVVDTHETIIANNGPLASFEGTLLKLEGPNYRLHVQNTQAAAVMWGTAIRDAMLAAAGVVTQTPQTIAREQSLMAAKLPATGTVPNTTQTATPGQVAAVGTAVSELVIPSVGEIQTAVAAAITAKLPAGSTEIAAAGSTAKTLDAVGSGGGGAATVKPTVVHPQHVWRFDPNRPSARAKDIVEVPVGFAGWLAFEPPLNGGTGVSAVSSVTIGASTTGLTELAPSGDFRQAVFKTAARTVAGTFAVSAVITTTDGQTLPLAATLKVV